MTTINHDESPLKPFYLVLVRPDHILDDFENLKKNFEKKTSKAPFHYFDPQIFGEHTMDEKKKKKK